MNPYNKITIVRNRHRVRDLHVFREFVQAYFERPEYDTDGLQVEWDNRQATRAQINQMLPRVVQVVNAAGLGAAATVTNPGVGVGNPDAVQNIFTARYANTDGQEILDVLDMAIGVYEGGRFAAMARTANPFFYAARILGFVIGLPRMFFATLGFPSFRSRPANIEEKGVVRLEAVTSRLAQAEELIEMRIAEIHERYGHQLAQSADQIAELAERLDFAERMLTQQRPMIPLESPATSDVATPV